jgi:hypothetical protein
MVARAEDDGQLCPSLLDLPQDLYAVHPRHPDIEENQVIERLLFKFKPLEGLLARTDAFDIETLLLKLLFIEQPDILFLFIASSTNSG